MSGQGASIANDTTKRKLQVGIPNIRFPVAELGYITSLINVRRFLSFGSFLRARFRAKKIAGVRFEDNPDESAVSFGYIANSMFSTSVAAPPTDAATNVEIFSDATITLTDSTGDDKGSAWDLGGPAGAENISISDVNGLGTINTVLSINAHTSWFVLVKYFLEAELLKMLILSAAPYPTLVSKVSTEP